MKTDSEDKILLSLLEERAVKCGENMMITESRFLDMHERSLGSSLRLPPDVKRVFYGGFEGAERSMAMFFPDYTGVTDYEGAEKWFKENPADCPIRILKITKDKFSKPLSHRDYLGAAMGLGINRDVTGDITVSENGCLMAVAAGMAEYIAENMNKAGRGTLSTVILMPYEAGTGERNEGTPDSFTVSSPRLDSIIKNGFGISRDDACSAIEHGLVFINDSECLKPDRKINNGDKVTLRHRGRIIIDDCSAITKKGRNIIKIRRF